MTCWNLVASPLVTAKARDDATNWYCAIPTVETKRLYKGEQNPHNISTTYTFAAWQGFHIGLSMSVSLDSDSQVSWVLTLSELWWEENKKKSSWAAQLWELNRINVKQPLSFDVLMGCVACKAAKASNGDPLDFWWWKLNQQRDADNGWIN